MLQEPLLITTPCILSTECGNSCLDKKKKCCKKYKKKGKTNCRRCPKI